MALHVDSVDKIVNTYFALVAAQPFTYKGRTYQPRSLNVRPGLFDVYQCPSGCGGCCQWKFSLDYLPEPKEKHPYPLKARTIPFDGRVITVFSDLQHSVVGACGNLRQSDGRCNIHGDHPFSCDFEVIRFKNFSKKAPVMTQQAFSRGWSYRRTDGGTEGASCQKLGKSSPTAQSVSEVVRRLQRLQVWTHYFGLKTKLPEIIGWAAQGPHTKPQLF